MTNDERSPSDWESRVQKSKDDGTWYAPNEEPSPYSPQQQRRRFLIGAGVALLAGLVLGPLLHVLSGRSGPALSLDVLIGSIARSIFPALVVGWSLTRGAKKKQRREGN